MRCYSRNDGSKFMQRGSIIFTTHNFPPLIYCETRGRSQIRVNWRPRDNFDERACHIKTRSRAGDKKRLVVQGIRRTRTVNIFKRKRRVESSEIMSRTGKYTFGTNIRENASFLHFT